MLLSIFVYKFFCGHMFSFLLGIYLGVHLLGHIVILCLTFGEIAKTVFHRDCTILHSHQQCMRLPINPHLHQYLLLSVFLIILVGVKWYLIVGFFFFSGIEPSAPAVEVWGLNHWTAREVPLLCFFFLNKFIYLYFLLLWVFIAVRGLLIAVASLIAEHGAQASVVVAHGLRCSVACGICPGQGSNPCPLHWQADSFFFFFFYLVLAALGLCCCGPAFSSCGEWELLFVEVHRLLIVVASLVAERRL